MLRMPAFQYHHPRSTSDAVAMWHAEGDAMYIAGGTDLLPNIKHRLFTPKHVIGLSGLPRPQVVDGGGSLLIDGGISLHALSQNPLILEHAPNLARAAGLVAGPQIRRMGTLGGNILLDTRCLFYNQTEFWRASLGYCLKKTGDWCHVIGSARTCVAAQSADTVPVLLAMDAQITLLGPDGERELSMRELYHFNGMAHLKIEKGELLTRVRVPMPGAGYRGSYQKLRVRGSIDFPQLSLAIAGIWSGDVPESLQIVVGAINPRPRPLKKLDAFIGSPMNETAIDGICSLVFKQARPQGSVPGDAGWRRSMAAIFARRALSAMREGREV